MAKIIQFDNKNIEQKVEECVDSKKFAKFYSWNRKYNFPKMYKQLCKTGMSEQQIAECMKHYEQFYKKVVLYAGGIDIVNYK